MSRPPRGIGELLELIRPLQDESPRARLPVGVAPLDAALGGGLPAQQLIQIAGAAGSGKTQLCLHMVAQILLRSFNPISAPSIVWIQTEGSFPVERLRDILGTSTQMLAIILSIAARTGLHPTDPHILQLLSQVFVDHVTHKTRLLYALSDKLPQLVSKFSKSVELIVIDSVANVFRQLEQSWVSGSSFEEYRWKRSNCNK